SIVEPPSRFTDLAVTHILPLGIPLLVIFMGRSIARDQVVIAWLAISASFVCSAVRLILTNSKQRRVTKELLDAERALVRSERMLSSAFRSSPDAFSINVFPDGPYLDVNESFTRLTGYSREEAIHRTPKELNLWTEPARRAQVLSQLGENKEVSGLVAVRDITERKVAEELMRTSEQRFRSLVEHLHVGIASFDPQGRAQFANQAALDMFGLQLPDVLGKTGAELGLEPLREDSTPLSDPARPLQSVYNTGRPLYN